MAAAAAAMFKVLLAPMVILPEVKVSVPLTVGLLFSVSPLLFDSVRLSSCVTLEGRFTPDAAPPKVRLDEDVVERLVGVPAIVGPLSVRVFAPTEKAPLVNVRVLLTVRFEVSATPPVVLAIVRL